MFKQLSKRGLSLLLSGPQQVRMVQQMSIVSNQQVSTDTPSLTTRVENFRQEGKEVQEK